MRRSRVWQGLSTDTVAGSEVEAPSAAGGGRGGLWTPRSLEPEAQEGPCRPAEARAAFGLARSIGSAETPQAGQLQVQICEGAKPEHARKPAARSSRHVPGSASQDTGPLECGVLARAP